MAQRGTSDFLATPRVWRALFATAALLAFSGLPGGSTFSGAASALSAGDKSSPWAADWDRDRDYYGGGYGYGGYKDYYGPGAGGAYRDLYGGLGGRDPYGYGGLPSDRKDGVPDDDCSRVEAGGVALADALREAAELIAAGHRLKDLAKAIAELVDFFNDEKHRRFLLANCPQAVALATLLQVESEAQEHSSGGACPGSENRSSDSCAAGGAVDTGEASADAMGREASGRAAAENLGGLLATAPGLRSPYRAPPQWSGSTWEALLNGAQQRTGVVLFPTGEQQFHVEYIPLAEWTINPRRRCTGRRDLGNLQATPLRTCLAKCMAHPLCMSATFWHWQPGMFGFEQRCFLSSTCTSAHTTSDGADGAVLFEKRQPSDGHRARGDLAKASSHVEDIIMTPRGAPWAPRCGHRLIATSVGTTGPVQLWLFGGVGVDPFSNATVVKPASGDGGMARSAVGVGSGLGGLGTAAGSPSRSAEAGGEGRRRGDARKVRPRAGERTPESNATSNVIEAYLNRHVELSGELPPLRSLPYGRLGDAWRSTDLGRSWTLVAQEAPWGRRAFFGAASIRSGGALLVFGGVRTPATGAQSGSAEVSAQDAPEGGLARAYSNDVWWADIAAAADPSGIEWHELPSASWAPRAGFQALVRRRFPGGDQGTEPEEEVILLGGRLADGGLMADVWAALVLPDRPRDSSGTDAVGPGGPLGSWSSLVARAAWTPRADFAAAVLGGEDLFVFGGCDQAGLALSDVWRSNGGQVWQQVTAVAPWGPRVGAVAIAAGASAGSAPAVLLFGGYAYPDSNVSRVPAEAADGADWATPIWASADGVFWQKFNVTGTSWTPDTMHAAMVAGPCESGGRSAADCAYVVGGLTHEGYYDNTVHRLPVPSELAASPKELLFPDDIVLSEHVPSGSSTLQAHVWIVPSMFAALMLVAYLARRRWQKGKKRHGGGSVPNGDSSTRNASMDPTFRLLLGILCGLVVLATTAAACALFAFSQLARELRDLRDSGGAECHSIGADAMDRVREALGLQRATERWEQFETLLRLASREPQFSSGGLGGFHDSWRGSSGGRGNDAYGGYGRYGDRGYGYDGLYGAYGGGYDDYWRDQFESEVSAKGGSSRERELSMLPTTQSLSCRSPHCDRNATACAGTGERSLSSPYGCCSDYMTIMLEDVTGWLTQQGIPYFVTYGTLLGAVRENDILPWTQDMDIVVDRAYWPQLQRGLEAAEFFGGRRYLFGVDQWEERVSRVCADWEGFAASVIGGPDSDRLSRGTEFHLDVYASDWWQITDMHLIDCVEPLGFATVPIRGRNFSAPARPRACLEKLYGAEWRTPKHALSGVN